MATKLSQYIPLGAYHLDFDTNFLEWRYLSLENREFSTNFLFDNKK